MPIAQRNTGTLMWLPEIAAHIDVLRTNAQIYAGNFRNAENRQWRIAYYEDDRSIMAMVNGVGAHNTTQPRIPRRSSTGGIAAPRQPLGTVANLFDQFEIKLYSIPH
jgi:hypothetical protein